MTEQPTITQADRDAAAAYWKASMIGSSMTQKLYKSGEFDSSLIVQAFARHRTTSLAAQDKQVLALVEAARDAGDVLQSAATPSNLDPQFSGQIAALGERIGYGALMHGASALWRKSLGDLAGSEFAAGPCVSTAASRLARLDDALMPFRGETLPATPSLAAQDGLDEHFPTGLRQRPMRLATTDEVFEGPVFCDCYCGESFAGSDEQEVRQLWAEHALSAIKEQHHD